VHAPVALEAASEIATSAVNYVRRTLETVVLSDARDDDRFGSDPYVAREGPRSLLCVPVLHKSRLIGCMYLENNLAAGAFTQERTLLSTMLASQAAIAIENARHNQGMKQEIERRSTAEAELRRALGELELLKNRLHAENAYLQEEIRHEHNFEEMVGNSRALLDVLHQIELVAPTDSTVLVVGETGTGKELIARALHDRSARQGRPLVKVNCGAISAGLVESELFGHVKGAFTGALERRTGRFELADGGTLFLDEVGELPLDTQVKLLRVLQEAEFEPVGSSTTVRVNVRIIAATNRNLEEAVALGRFRSDLFYRLNVLRLDVPPLRERDGDLPELVMFFLTRLAKKFGKPVLRVTQETLDQLVAYDWPGNIRELGNVIERAVVLSRGPVLMLALGQLPVPSLEHPGRARGVARTTSGASGAPPPAWAMRDVEREHILSVLGRTGGVVEGPRGAAAILELHPNTLRSRMKRLGIR
jgi:formate hydrogenlyase transcriptional activator